jgi:hypothetical protein
MEEWKQKIHAKSQSNGFLVPSISDTSKNLFHHTSPPRFSEKLEGASSPPEEIRIFTGAAFICLGKQAGGVGLVDESGAITHLFSLYLGGFGSI